MAELMVKNISSYWYYPSLIAVIAILGGCRQPEKAAQESLLGHQDKICSIAFSIDGKKLVSGSADATIRIWDVQTRTCLHVLDQPNDWVHCVDVSPDGVHFASGGRDQVVRVWNLNSGELERELEGHTGIIFSVHYTANGDRLVSYGNDKTIRIWDVASGTCEKATPIRTFWTPSGFVLIPKTNLAVLAGDYPEIWDLDKELSVQTYEGHEDSIGSVAVSSDGECIASGGKYQDHSLRFWDRHSAECLWSKNFGVNQGVDSLLFSPNDDVLISGHFSGKIVCWNPSTGEELRSTQAHTRMGALALSRDLILASAGSDGPISNIPTIKLWKFDSLEPAIAPPSINPRDTKSGDATEQIAEHDRELPR